VNDKKKKIIDNLYLKPIVIKIELTIHIINIK